MSTTNSQIFGTSTAWPTWTLNSLASSSSAGRRSAVLDISAISPVPDDILVTINLKSGAGALSNDKASYIYGSKSEDGTNYSGGSDEAAGSGDGAITIDSPTCLSGPVTVPMPSSSTTYTVVISLLQLFGGVLPRKCALIDRNYTGQGYAASGCSASYTCVNFQDA